MTSEANGVPEDEEQKEGKEEEEEEENEEEEAWSRLGFAPKTAL